MRAPPRDDIGSLLRELLLPLPKQILHADKKVIKISSEARFRGKMDGIFINHGLLEPQRLRDETVESFQHLFNVQAIMK